uniref:hypothetical protein n=1 Tax=Marinoscillum pacificum TaxID=392723 RepID=UPI00358E598C
MFRACLLDIKRILKTAGNPLPMRLVPLLKGSLHLQSFSLKKVCKVHINCEEEMVSVL